MTGRIGIVLAAVLLAAPALAQDGSETATNRTPANAQKFIQTMPPYIVSAFRRSTLAWADNMSVTGVSSPEACVTVLTAATSSGTEDIRIDWSVVDRVSLDASGPNGPAVGLSLRIDYPAALHITFTGSEQRNRVGAAMQYLKSSCDKAAQLGF